MSELLYRNYQNNIIRVINNFYSLNDIIDFLQLKDLDISKYKIIQISFNGTIYLCVNDSTLTKLINLSNLKNIELMSFLNWLNSSDYIRKEIDVIELTSNEHNKKVTSTDDSYIYMQNTISICTNAGDLS